MQKWRRVLLAGLLIAAVIGGILGFFMAKSGSWKDNVIGSINGFDLFMFSFVVIVLICEIIDIYSVNKGKRQFGSVKFSVAIQSAKRLKKVFIILVVISVAEFIGFAFSPTLAIFSLCMMASMLTVRYGIHNHSSNAIGENGICQWGVFHQWEKVKSYEIKDGNLLNVKIVQRVLWLKYDNEIKLLINTNEKEEIDEYLTDRIHAKIASPLCSE